MENENTKIQNEQDNDKKKKRLILIIPVIVVALTLAIVLPITLSKCSRTKYTYSDPTYTWSTDNKTCTAERIANEDPDHKETETVDSTTCSIIHLCIVVESISFDFSRASSLIFASFSLINCICS